MKILAVDFGDARTGLAICDKDETLASPLGVIHEKNYERIVEKVAEKALEEKVALIIVGYPKNMDNSVGPRAEKSEAFSQDLKAATGLEVELWDERGTTITAVGHLNTTNTRGKKRKNIVDAVAATVILENHLNWRRNQKKKD